MHARRVICLSLSMRSMRYERYSPDWRQTMSAQPKEEWPLNVGPTDKSTDLFGIARAFAAAQTEMHNPGFDATNPHFRNKFASLAAVRNAVVPILAKHGICVSQDLASVEGGVSCVTILTHATGQQMRFGPLVLPVS